LTAGNEPMEKGTQLGAFGSGHVAEIQQMPPAASPLRRRGALDEEVLTLDDVATGDGGVQEP
jgi:hypothetical protein